MADFVQTGIVGITPKCDALVGGVSEKMTLIYQVMERVSVILSGALILDCWLDRDGDCAAK